VLARESKREKDYATSALPSTKSRTRSLQFPMRDRGRGRGRGRCGHDSFLRVRVYLFFLCVIVVHCRTRYQILHGVALRPSLLPRKESSALSFDRWASLFHLFAAGLVPVSRGTSYIIRRGTRVLRPKPVRTNEGKAGALGRILE